MKIEFTLDQLQTLNEALMALPYFKAAPLIAAINEQLAEQQKAMDTPVEVPAA